MVTECKNQDNSLEFETTTQFKSGSYGPFGFHYPSGSRILNANVYSVAEELKIKKVLCSYVI
jgi:hypothetical protein